MHLHAKQLSAPQNVQLNALDYPAEVKWILCAVILKVALSSVKWNRPTTFAKLLGYISCKLCVLPDYNLKNSLQINTIMKQIGLLDGLEFGLKHVSLLHGQILSPFWTPKYDYSQEPVNET